MSDHVMKLMQCGEITIAASCHATSDEKVPFYLPGNALVYMKTGTLHVESKDGNYNLGPGQFGILRKFSEGTMHKTFAPAEKEANLYTFMLTNVFVERIVKDLLLSSKVPPFTQEWLSLPATPDLNAFIEGVITSIEQDEDFDRQKVEEQTYKALVAILNSDENAAMAFREYAIYEAADLLTYMNYNFMYNMPLELFARQSGRSLSSFNREFRKIFKETPRKWLMKKRLQFAFDLLSSGKKASDIYVQTGFEDLGHFSRAFKKEFGMVPSLVKASPEKLGQATFQP
ncbi:MAG: AraC family transcriptional regulator [Cytophagales bacterium]|nr:AraC family transcriptional regulator [Cytophagales bacterium]